MIKDISDKNITMSIGHICTVLGVVISLTASAILGVGYMTNRADDNAEAIVRIDKALSMVSEKIVQVDTNSNNINRLSLRVKKLEG